MEENTIRRHRPGTFFDARRLRAGVLHDFADSTLIRPAEAASQVSDATVQKYEVS